MNELLNQTYGVEVEMYNITRQKAAQVVANVIKEYAGISSLISHPGGTYDTWMVSALTRGDWQLMYDSSIQASCHQEKCELVTPILCWEDMPLLQEIIRALRKAGARSNPAHSCGIHVHVGGEHTAQSLLNLTNIMASHEQLLIGALGLTCIRTSHWCQPVHPNFLREANRTKPATLPEMENVWYRSQDCDYGRNQHYNASRYHMLNLHSYFTGKGVEFRLFQFDDYNPLAPRGQRGGLHAGQLKAYVQLCLALNYRAMHTKKAKYQPLESENQKYTMRCWLLRLGFIGPEFATAREQLTRRLPGDTAWRHGRPAKPQNESPDDAA